MPSVRETSVIIKIILFGAGIAVGFALGHKRIEVPPPDPAIAQLEALKSKLQSISDADLADYGRLKTLEEKYKKADEILGKIMGVFIAELGLRAKFKAGAAPPPAAAQAAPPAEIAPPTGLRPDPKKPNEYTKVPKPLDPRLEAFALRGAEKLIPEIRNNQDAKNFLDKVKANNFNLALKGSQPFSREEDLTFLNGNFGGEAHVEINGEDHTWRIRLRFDVRIENGAAKGRVRVVLLENDKEFSNSSSNGDLSNMRQFAQDSQAILLRISPTMYLQLYYVKNLDSLAGHVYRQPSEVDDFAHVGSFILLRR